MSNKITVIGTGYVGLVSGVGLSDLGNYVTCVDIDKEKISLLNERRIPIYEPGLQEYLNKNVDNGRLFFSTNIDEAIQKSDIVFICVGTPTSYNGEVDLSQVKRVAKIISHNLNNYKVIVTKSTVPVGTNRWLKEYIKNISQNQNFDVISNPEFLREGKAVQDFFHPDRIVIGYDSEQAKEIMKEIYRPLYLIETPFLFCNFETAELIKYASNAFLATKITFINQIANLCEEIGADVHIIAKAMGMDGRISPKFLHPGPGFGGSCFPKDIKALVEIGDKYNINMSLIKEVITSNENQKRRMVDKLLNLIGSLENKTIAVLGLAFKAETDDTRESPSILIINELLGRGAKVKVHDPQAIENAKNIFGQSVSYYSDKYQVAENADALIILTEWNEYRNIDLNELKKIMKGNIILDTRNILDPLKTKEAGFIYEGVGRK